MAIIKKTRDNKYWRVYGEREPCVLWVGLQSGPATMEDSMEVPQEIKNSPDWYGSVGWILSCKAKGHQFDSRSGLWGGPHGVCARGLMFLSCIYVSLFLLPFLSL